MNWTTLAFLGLVLLISGCAVNTQERDKIVKVAPSEINILVKTKSFPATPTSQKERPKQKTAHPKTESLKNKTAREIIFALGNPDFRRTDKPAELWQYQHKKCNLDLFLYPEGNKKLSVKFLDIRVLEKNDIAPQVCLQSIIEAKTRTHEPRWTSP